MKGWGRGGGVYGFLEVERKRSESCLHTSAVVFATLKLNPKKQLRRCWRCLRRLAVPGKLDVLVFTVVGVFINASRISSELGAHANPNRASRLIAFN